MSVPSPTFTPRHCSGDMYAGVPMTMPVCVRCPSSASPTSLAMPKSSSFAYASPCCGCTIQMLSGFRSR